MMSGAGPRGVRGRQEERAVWLGRSRWLLSSIGALLGLLVGVTLAPAARAQVTQKADGEFVAYDTSAGTVTVHVRE